MWVLLAAAIVSSAWYFMGEEEVAFETPALPAAPTANVEMVDGTQVVAVTAKYKYLPEVSVAKAGVPTAIHLKTDRTNDCTVEVSIPRLRYRTVLPTTGVTVVEVPPQNAGTTLQGVCWMGMYSFQVRFV